MLTGCLLTPDPINPALDVPTGYRTPHSTAKAELSSAEWWRGFRSRELTELIDQALAANYDIAAAVGRIMQADAQARVTGAALLLTLDASGNTARSGTSASGSASTPSSVHSVALNASYVVDFWGRNRDLLRSAEFGASASRFDRDLIALTTMASVFAQQDMLAQVRFTRLEAIVSLFQALGGGWPEKQGSSEAEGGRSSMPDAGRHSP
jgi:multidrug efflux system outer membrane protein